MTWPEGPICDPCYTAALRRRGRCADCGRERRLVAPPGRHATTCADCSGSGGPTGHVCRDCGREDKLFTRGRCARCSLRSRLDTLLAGADGEVPAPLLPVRTAIVAGPQPRTALNWLRSGAGRYILAGLARGEIRCSHEGLDAATPRRAAEYLRALLVAHAVLPARDEALARLDRAVAELLDTVADPDDRRVVTAYASWRVLHRVRRRAAERPAPRTATRYAGTCLRAAVGLLAWLRIDHVRLAELGQADVDRWLLTGPATLRYQAADFLSWAAARRLAPRVTLTRPSCQAGHATGEEQRSTQLRRLHDPDVATVDRVAGTFLLLYGQPLSRIAGMTRQQIHQRDTVVSVRFGRTDLELAEQLSGFVRAQLTAPRRHDSLGAPQQDCWLFPGHLPGRPITAPRLGQRLRNLGIDVRAGRRAALLQLAAEVPAAVLADLLGFTTASATDWVHAAGGDWSRYAADTARSRRTEPLSAGSSPEVSR